MRHKKIRLNFWAGPAGFSLRDADFKGDIFSLEDYEVIGDQALYAPDGHIVAVSETFTGDVIKLLNIYIQEARRLNIPGRYDVPELGLKDATFVEVLEAIRDYYAPSFSPSNQKKHEGQRGENKND